MVVRISIYSIFVTSRHLPLLHLRGPNSTDKSRKVHLDRCMAEKNVIISRCIMIVQVSVILKSKSELLLALKTTNVIVNVNVHYVNVNVKVIVNVDVDVDIDVDVNVI